MSFAVDQHLVQNMPLNQEMREFVDSEPGIEPFEDMYLVAFWRLVTERRGGPVIPYSEIVKYGEQEGLDSAMIGTFVDVIWSLDKAHNDWLKSEIKRARIED